MAPVYLPETPRYLSIRYKNASFAALSFAFMLPQKEFCVTFPDSTISH